MIRRAIFGLLSLALLAGCAGEDLTDLQQYAERIKAKCENIEHTLKKPLISVSIR